MTEIIANENELTGCPRRRARGEGPTPGGRQASRSASAWAPVASPPGSPVQEALDEEICRRKALSSKVRIVGTGCLGPCSGGPAVMIDDVFYENLRPQDAKEIVTEHLGGGGSSSGSRTSVPTAAPWRGRDMDFFHRQKKIVLRQLRPDRPAADRRLHRPRRLSGPGQGADAERSPRR